MRKSCARALPLTAGTDDGPRFEGAAEGAGTVLPRAESEARSSPEQKVVSEAVDANVRDQKLPPSTERSAEASPGLATIKQSKQSPVKASRPSSGKARPAKKKADGQLQRNSATFNPLL